MQSLSRVGGSGVIFPMVGGGAAKRKQRRRLRGGKPAWLNEVHRQQAAADEAYAKKPVSAEEMRVGKSLWGLDTPEKVKAAQMRNRKKSRGQSIFDPSNIKRAFEDEGVQDIIKGTTAVLAPVAGATIASANAPQAPVGAQLKPAGGPEASLPDYKLNYGKRPYVPADHVGPIDRALPAWKPLNPGEQADVFRASQWRVREMQRRMARGDLP